MCFKKIIIFTMVCLPLQATAHKVRHKGPEAPPSIVKQLKTSLNKINAGYLQDIKPIFEKKCFDCHSSQTVFPWYYKIPGIRQMIQSDIDEARDHLNMDSGFPFKSHASPLEDLEAISESIRTNDMPPATYRIMHPKSALTPEEKEKVYRWVELGKALLKGK